MTQIISNISSLDPLLLAQAGDLGSMFTNLMNGNLGTSALGLLKALAIFLIGWFIVAPFVAGLIKKLLNSTDIDNRLASAISGQRGGEAIPIEDWIQKLILWLIRLFAVVAVLNSLQLDTVSAPLNNLLGQITGFIPKILGAAALLGIAWVVATIVKTIVVKGLGGLNIESRLGLDASESNNAELTNTVGNALYWFIFLLFLPAVLNALQLNGTLEPIQGMLDEVLAMLPNILGAVIIGTVFWFIANIVKKIVSNLLAATGVDSIGRKFGFGGGSGGKQSLSSILGTVVFVLILIPGIISALEQLQISAISEPATDMLNQVMDLMPKVFAAGVVLAFFYVAGQFVSDFVTNILTNVGFNNLLQWLGLSKSGADSSTSGESLTGEPMELGLGTEQPTMIQTGSAVASKTPSELVGLLCLVGIMLIATLTAVDILGIPALQEVVSVVLAIAAQVLVGVIVFAIGLYLANMAHNLILASGASQAGLLAQSARIAILVLVGAMALNRIGIAPNIVNLAFGLILGGIAVAIALAFGLGGREVAKEELRSWVNSFKSK